MKICYIGWGDHVHVERWAGWFARSGDHVSIISVSGFGSYPQGVEQYRLEGTWAARLSYRLRVRRLEKLLGCIRPDLVHVHWAHFASLLDGRWAGPTVITAWGSDVYRLDHMHGDVRDSLIRALRRASLVTCDSRDQAETLETLAALAPGAVEVVQWGVDTALFTPEPRPGRLAHELGISECPVILSPRNFTQLYNLDQIVTAFAGVVRARPDAILLMKRYRGDEEYCERIDRLIDELDLRGHVHIVSELAYEDMADFYRSGRVLVSIPTSDGTPMSLLEGMACGCVPVVSDLRSVAEWVRDGEQGYVVPVGAATEKLVVAILAALEDGESTRCLTEKNAQMIRALASQEAHMTRMRSMYQALIGGSGT